MRHGDHRPDVIAKGQPPLGPGRVHVHRRVLRLKHLDRNILHVLKEMNIRWPAVADILYVTLRNDEGMVIRDRCNVAKAEHVTIFIQDLRGQLTSQDISKDRRVV